MLKFSVKLTDGQVKEIAKNIGWTETISDFLMVPTENEDGSIVDRLTQVELANPIEYDTFVQEYLNNIVKNELASLYTVSTQKQIDSQIESIKQSAEDARKSFIEGL